jgi:hypothetical protein
VVAYLRAATGGRPYTGGCINLMWTDLDQEPVYGMYVPSPIGAPREYTVLAKHGLVRS